MGRSTNRNLRNRRRLQQIGKKLRRQSKAAAKAAKSAPKTA
jgi:hypothetical protein